MKRYSKLLIVLVGLVLVSLIVVSACAPAPAKQYVMKLASDHSPGLPTETALNKMKEIIEAGTGGNIKVEVYMQSLGTGREVLEGLQLGTIEGAAVVGAANVPFNPAIGILDLPFMFSSPERAYELVEGKLGDELLDTFEGTGMIGGAIWAGGGFKHFTGNFPIHSPADFAGKRIRVTPNPLLAKQYESLGANPVPIDFMELYNALQEGVVDGEENGLIAIHSMKFYEVQKYIALSSHGWNSYIVTFSEKFMDQLSGKYQDIIMDSAKEVAALNRSEMEKLEYGVWMQNILDAGTSEVYELTAAEKQAFVAKMGPVYDAAPAILKLDGDGQKLMAKFIEEGAKPAGK